MLTILAAATKIAVVYCDLFSDNTQVDDALHGLYRRCDIKDIAELLDPGTNWSYMWEPPPSDVPEEPDIDLAFELHRELALDDTTDGP